MSLSVQRSNVEPFSFNGKNIKTMDVSCLGKCPVGIDFSRAIGYVDDNNGRRAIKRHVKKSSRFDWEMLRQT